MISLNIVSCSNISIIHCFRRGFTLNGQPIPNEKCLDIDGKMMVMKVKEESNAYFFWAIYITLVLLAIGNLVTTLIVVHVLR